MLFDANSDAAAGASSSVSRGHARGPPVRLMSIGGSMIAGGIPGGCPGSFSGHNRYDDSCTYPRLFAAKLAKKNGVSFENGAQGGTSTLSALPLLDTILREGTDLLLVDYSVNDALAIDTSGTAKPRDYSRWSMQVGAATEALVRHMLARYPRTALLLVDAYCHETSLQQQKAAIARHYRIPYFAFVEHLQGHHRKAACERAWGPRGLPHPNASTHEHIAHTLAAWWQRKVGYDGKVHADLSSTIADLSAAATSANGNLPGPLKNESLQLLPCRPITMYDAMRPDSSGKMGPNVSRGNWTLYADRPGKPGFISTGPHGSQLAFWLRFGAQPRLVLLYDRSYRGFADAVVQLDGSELAVGLRGMRTDAQKITQTELLQFDLTQDITPVYGRPGSGTHWLYHSVSARLKAAGVHERVQRLAGLMSMDGVEREGETRHRMNAASFGVVEPFSSRLLRVTLVTKQDTDAKFKLKLVSSC